MVAKAGRVKEKVCQLPRAQGLESDYPIDRSANGPI